MNSEEERTVQKPNRDDTHEQRGPNQCREGVVEDPPASRPSSPSPPEREETPGKPTPGAPSIPYTLR